MRRILSFGLLLASASALAQTTEGIIVKAGSAEQQFAIADVKELTFSDEGLTVVKTDEATVEFPAGWQISFGQVGTSGLSFATQTDGDCKVLVFNLEGILVAETKLSDLQLGSLPGGVYILKFNGKSLKIKK